MEKADRLTGRTIQAVIGQSVRGPRPQHEGVQDWGYGDASKWSHAVGDMCTSGGNIKWCSFNYIWSLADSQKPTISSGSTETLFIEVYSNTKTQGSNITEIPLGTTETLLICSITCMQQWWHPTYHILCDYLILKICRSPDFIEAVSMKSVFIESSIHWSSI